MTLEEGRALRERLLSAFLQVDVWRSQGYAPMPSFKNVILGMLVSGRLACSGMNGDEIDALLDAMERKYERDKRILRSA